MGSRPDLRHSPDHRRPAGSDVPATPWSLSGCSLLGLRAGAGARLGFRRSSQILLKLLEVATHRSIHLLHVAAGVAEHLGYVFTEVAPTCADAAADRVQIALGCFNPFFHT